MKNKNIKYISLFSLLLFINACGSSEKTNSDYSALPIQEKPSLQQPSKEESKPLGWLQGSWKGDLYYGHKEGDLEISLEYQDDQNIEIFYPKEQCHSKAKLNRKTMILKEVFMEGECQENTVIKLIPIDKHEEYIDEGFESLSDIKLLHIEYSKLQENDDIVRGILEKE